MLNLSLTDAEWFLIESIKHRNFINVEKLRSLFYKLGDEFAYNLCKKNMIVSIAADAMQNCGIQLSERWYNELNTTETRIAQYMAELDRVAELLNDHGIPLIALKNSGIAKSLYPHLGASPMGDIDLLVQKIDFRRAHGILIKNGYELNFRSPLETENLDAAEQGGGAEYSTKLDSGENLWLELQWRPVAGRWINPDREPDASYLMKRSENIPDSYARLLAPEDNLLQVCLHTAKHSFVRAPGFRLHTDVDRIVHACDINWELFCTQVEKLKVRTAVFFSLAFAHDLLESPIPYHVLQRLAPSRWKINLISFWLQKVGLFDPNGSKWGRMGYICFVSLLYDDIYELISNIFPKRKFVENQYGVISFFDRWVFYLNRLLNILFSRNLVTKNDKSIRKKKL